MRHQAFQQADFALSETWAFWPAYLYHAQNGFVHHHRSGGGVRAVGIRQQIVTDGLRIEAGFPANQCLLRQGGGRGVNRLFFWQGGNR